MSHKKLNEWYATAICGNDITSSVLYVSALTIAAAGQYAWIALLMVSATLFLFRKIYHEVVGALPLNGGAYNVLLNSSSKSNASVAATLTILSYMATAVISATEGMHYLHHIFPSIHVIWATFFLLLLFLGLTILGISESAIVALVIFVVHLTTMLLLVVFCFVFIASHGLDNLSLNWQTPIKADGILTALFYGFSAAMLGISGFESSANFVEEQEQGVFPKTLKNMWIAVSILNPLMAVLAICIMPMHEVETYQNSFLSHMGEITGGKTLAFLISINAVLVLSGAVLTSFVGVNGLIKRMTLDRILPQFFLKANKRGSTYRILILFFALCVSVLYVTNGEIGPLAGVYAISFLTVMALFAIGNILLKLRRKKLPRPEIAEPTSVLLGLIAIIIALYGTIKANPSYLVTFLNYFIPSILVIMAMLARKDILMFLAKMLKSVNGKYRKHAIIQQRTLDKTIQNFLKQEFVFFSKGDDISSLNKVMMYLHQNEVTNKIKIVSILEEDNQPTDQFMKDFDALDRAYPEVDMEYIVEIGRFTPEKVDELSNRWKIPKNFMFIASPGERFSHRVEDLGGVRLIM
ncbi:MAG: APC family permease [Chitinophagales bacterium]|jgi:amino acid transporter|nr:APC family permease [Chitinophagales bacterium]